MVLLLLTFAGVPARADEPLPGDPIPTPPEYVADVERAERIGRDLFEIDSFSALATDALRVQTSGLADPRLSGWVVIDDGQRAARFLGEVDGELHVIYDARRWDNGPFTAVALDPPVALTSEERARANARLTAIRAMPFHCSDRYNTVLLPSEEGGWSVYLSPGTLTHNLLIYGGHFRVDVSADGLTAGDVMAFSNTCIASRYGADRPPDPEGETWIGLYFTHVVTPTPTEIHVFLNLVHDVRLAIDAESGSWIVDGGEVSYVSPIGRLQEESPTDAE